jgi:hypothetical protein
MTSMASGTRNPSRLGRPTRRHRRRRELLGAGVAGDRRVVHLEERVLREVLRVEVDDDERRPFGCDPGEPGGVLVAGRTRSA